MRGRRPSSVVGRPSVWPAGLAAVLAPATAWAWVFDPSTHGYLIDFVVIVGVLVWVLRPIVRKALASRHDAVKADLDGARDALAEAETRVKAMEARVAHLSTEIDGLMNEFRSLGQAERDNLTHEGAILAEKVREETEFRLSQTVKMMRADLARTVVESAFATVEKRAGETGRRPLPDGLVDQVVRGV
jgi:F-type H+-transporting ATPase subunit b